MKNNIINILNPVIDHVHFIEDGFVSIKNKKGLIPQLKSYGLNPYGRDWDDLLVVTLCDNVYPDIEVYWGNEFPKEPWDMENEENLKFLENCKIYNPFLQLKNVALKRMYDPDNIYYEAYVNKFIFWTKFKGHSREIVVLSGCYSTIKNEDQVKTIDFKKGSKK